MPDTSTPSPAPVQYDAALHTLAAQATTRYAGEHLRIAKGLVIALNHGATLQADGTALVQSQSEPEIVYAVNGHCDCRDATHGAPDGRCKHRWAKALTTRALALAAAPVETISTLTEQLFGPQTAAAAAQRTACGQQGAGGREIGRRVDTPSDPTSPTPTPSSPSPEEDDATLQAALDWDTQRAATQRPSAQAACPEAAFSLTLTGLLDGQNAMLTVRGQTAAEFTANLTAVRGLFDRPAAQPDSPPAAAQTEQRTCPLHGTAMVLRVNPKGSWWSHAHADGYCKGK